MNRITKLFSHKKNILSVYFTAGFPKVDSVITIINELERVGVDMIEIGIPFSDPLADGPVIQHSSELALENRMSLKLLFEQLLNSDVSQSEAAILLMGYLNPILQFGVKNFCKKAHSIGIDGVIIPDLPISEYLNDYKAIFDKYALKNIFLITPQTSEKRIRYIDNNSNGFIYMVSSSSTTGTKTSVDENTQKYFLRIKKMNLKNPLMIGFGISDKRDFSKACDYANGAIIGSAFINAIGNNKQLKKSINNFIKEIR